MAVATAKVNVAACGGDEREKQEPAIVGEDRADSVARIDVDGEGDGLGILISGCLLASIGATHDSLDRQYKLFVLTGAQGAYLPPPDGSRSTANGLDCIALWDDFKVILISLQFNLQFFADVDGFCLETAVGRRI